MTICLSVRRERGVERRFEIDKAKITIGADPLCDITVPDRGVDAEQALLVARADGVELFDIGASPGSLVNGRAVRHARLEPGDEIWIGSTVLRLLERGAGSVAFTEMATTVRAEIPTSGERARATAGAGQPAPSAGTERFALLNEVRRLINSIGTDEDVFESILDTLFGSVPVRRGMIAITGKGGDLEIKAHRNREHPRAASGPIQVSRTLVGKVLASGSALLTSDAEVDPKLSASQSIQALRIKAAICVPLVVEEKTIGLLYGDNRERPGALTAEHLSIVNALASVAAVAIEKFRLLEEYDAKLKIEQALSIARTIQRNLLPSDPPASDWLDVWGYSESCDETGGDYYDFFPMGDTGLGLVVADVTGHGVGPALLMATVRAALRALVLQESSLSRLLFRLNNFLCDDVRDGRFITLFLGRFEARERCLRYVGAGHTPPVFYRAAQRATSLVRSAGPPIGILRDLEYACGEITGLQSGDRLLLSTDGIIEAVDSDGEQYGFERLRARAEQLTEVGARQVVEAIRADVDRHRGPTPLRDDTTLVAVRVV